MDAQYALHIRPARPEDVGSIRRIARSSLEHSYSDVLDHETIGEAVTIWYANDTFQYRLSEDDSVFLVAHSGSELMGFSESELEADGAVGAINWLHVDPHHRGQGVGETLLEESEKALMEEGAMRIEGRVLEGNTKGNSFYRDHGYTQTGSRKIDIAGSTVQENRYLAFPGRETTEGLLEEKQLGGESVYVALDERERGSKAPFYMVYRDTDREQAYGFCCANCESMDVSMSPMGQIECENCENTRKATRWDAAYL